jgi:hypothetical protein
MGIEHSVLINAPRNAVFELYADVMSWPAWDRETLHVHLPLGLRTGASGWLKPRAGPKAFIRVSEVVANRSFTVEGRLPLCRMIFGHQLEDTANGTRATHSVRFDGPLAFVFRRLIGSGIDASLPTTLTGLKAASEELGR